MILYWDHTRESSSFSPFGSFLMRGLALCFFMGLLVSLAGCSHSCQSPTTETTETPSGTEDCCSSGGCCASKSRAEILQQQGKKSTETKQ